MAPPWVGRWISAECRSTRVGPGVAMGGSSLGSQPLADGLHDCEIGRRRDGYEAFADRADQLSAPADKARERHALEEGTLLDPVFDDVGDAVVESVEEQLEPGEHAWLDDRVVGEGLQSATAFAPSATASPPFPRSPPISRSSFWMAE